MTNLLTILVLALTSTNAFAYDCSKDIEPMVRKVLQKQVVNSIEKTNIVLLPDEDIPLYQGEVYNKGQYPVHVYLVKASYMGSKIYHGFLIDPRDCSVQDFYEVYFE